MRRLRNQVIAAQLGLLIVIAVIVTLAVGALRASSRGRERSEELASAWEQVDRLAVETRRFVEAARRYIHTGETRDRERAKQLELELAATRARTVARARELGETRPAALEAALDALASTISRAIAERPSARDPAPTAAELVERLVAFHTDIARHRLRLDEALDSIRAERRGATIRALDATDRRAHLAGWAVLAGAGLSLALAVSFTFVLMRELGRLDRARRPIISNVYIEPQGDEPRMLT